MCITPKITRIIIPLNIKFILKREKIPQFVLIPVIDWTNHNLIWEGYVDLTS